MKRGTQRDCTRSPDSLDPDNIIIAFRFDRFIFPIFFVFSVMIGLIEAV